MLNGIACLRRQLGMKTTRALLAVCSEGAKQADKTIHIGQRFDACIDKQNELKQANADLRETQAKLRAALGSREETDLNQELVEA